MQKVQAYTQSECKMDPKIGGEFTMFGGNVQGVFEKLVSRLMCSAAVRACLTSNNCMHRNRAS